MGNIIETQGILTKSTQVTLDANGNGVITFDPDSANQRWEITSVVVSTNQPATSTTVPVVTLGINTTQLSTMSASNQRGATFNGNQETFSGSILLGPCDFLSVIFGPPNGVSGTPLAGVIASAVVSGSKYTRRA